MKMKFVGVMRLVFIFVLKTAALFLATSYLTYVLMSQLPAPKTSIVRFTYQTWLRDLLMSFDLGYSDFFFGERIFGRVSVGLGTTLPICLVTVLASAAISILLVLFLFSPRKVLFVDKGISGKIVDSVLTAFLYFLSSFPVYLIGYFIFFVFKSEANYLLVLLSAVFGSSLTLDLFRSIGTIYKQELSKLYVKNALGLGFDALDWLPFPRTVAWEAFRNVLPIALPIISSKLPFVLSSIFVIELIFELPGLSDAFLTGLINRDFHLVLAVVTMSVLLIQVVGFLSEALAYVLEPQKEAFKIV